MGGVPVKHHSKGKVRRRRSHLGLSKKRLFACPECGGPKQAHAVCPQCKLHTGTRQSSKRTS